MNKYYLQGPFIAKVKDNVDPDKLGRVKVTAEVMGDSVESDWIPVATLSHGVFVLPEKDDQVVVAFMGDSPDNGVVLGSVWSDKQKPPETKENAGSDLNKDGKNNMRFIKSRSGHMIILDDKENEQKIQIIASGGKTRIEFAAKDKKMSIKTDKNLFVSAKGKFGIKADKGEVKFTKGFKLTADELLFETKSKDLTTKASQNLTLEGSTIKLN